MSADSTAVATPSFTARQVERFSKNPHQIYYGSLVWLHNAASGEGDAFLAEREKFEAVVDTLSSKQRLAILLEAYQRREEVLHGLRPTTWVTTLIENSFFRTLKATMDERGLNKLEVPDPAIKVLLEASYGKYEPDIDALALIAKDLSPEHREKLVEITPATDVAERTFTCALKDLQRELAGVSGETIMTVTVAAHTRPEKIAAGNSVAIMKVAEKHAGTDIETAIRLAMPRDRNRDKLTIAPHVGQPLLKTVTPS